MKKITDFLIDKRFYIFGLMVILAIISIFLEDKVKINYDMAKYLPKTSDTRIGMDIMEKEFAGTETSNLNVMFEGLQESSKQDVLNYLSNISGVKEVSYDETEKYNQDKYTLYVLTIDGKDDSKLASNVFQDIKEHFHDYTFYTSGSVANVNEDVLPFWIVVLAVLCALVILIIMCESYVEPFLFLASILMAVLLNKGTNIIFDSISFITVAIAAILQLALSMDYSIMLMNRYDQEKKREKDKVKAMKNALYHALLAISSSSLTTIVGLLALVFMSFTIGRDLGLVLAKGVLFSLICIFLVLPTLILAFDKWIVKTKKKTPHINLNKLGSLSYKGRFFITPLFVIVFIVSILLKGNLGYDYTNNEEDEISKHFKENNQMAIIYENKDEDKITKYLEKIKQNKNVDEVLGYGNTINESLTYDKLNSKLTDLGSDVTVSEYLLKIIYYNYYNKLEDNAITLENFLNFLENVVYKNASLNEKIDNKMKEDVTRLKNFATINNLNNPKNLQEIAQILDISESDVHDLLVYYLALNNNIKISIPNFVSFMLDDVLKDSQYSNSIDESAKNNLSYLAKFTNPSVLNQSYSVTDMANLFDIDEYLVSNLYTYYISLSDIDLKLTLPEFTNFVLNDLLTNSDYSNTITETDLANLKMLATFSNPLIINKEMTSLELSETFGIDESLVSLLLSIDRTATSPYKFVNFILNNSFVRQMLDADSLAKLTLVQEIMDRTLNEDIFTYEELSTLIHFDENTLKGIYSIYLASHDNLKLTSLNFVEFILNRKDDELLQDISSDTINNLELIREVITSVTNNKEYSSNELALLFNLDTETTNLLYGLYNYENSQITLSMKEVVNFLLNNVVNNSKYANKFDQNKINKLEVVNKIMQNTLNNQKYTSEEMINTLSKLTDDLDVNTIKVLYIYYGSEKEFDNSWTMTVEEFVNYLNNDILNNEEFQDFIDDEERQDIIEAKDTLRDANELLRGSKYSRVVLNTSFAKEGKETFAFVQNLKDTLKVDMTNFYIIGDSPMAYDISNTFNNELNYITIITMIAIFIVVAFTFKSLIIPIILVLIIQCAVFLTMGILSFYGDNVYFIAILIVQSILMGATIDYAILYTSYYLENRKTMDIKESVISSYNKSIHAILTSASILIIVTLIVGHFASAIASKICITISEGTICSTILIMFLLPSLLATCDRLIAKKPKKRDLCK